MMVPPLLKQLFLYIVLTASIGQARNYVVRVGNGGNVFSPSEVTAVMGDVIVFVFYSGVWPFNFNLNNGE